VAVVKMDESFMVLCKNTYYFLPVFGVIYGYVTFCVNTVTLSRGLLLHILD